MDRYDVLRSLGKGGSGEAFLVRDRRHPKQEIVLKRFHPSVAVKAVHAECERVASLSSPVVARLYEWGMLDDGSPYVTSAYVDGVHLYAYAQSLHVKEKIALLAQLSLALDFIHTRGIVHLDLKPENILIQKHTPHSVVLIDFGLSQATETMKVNRTVRFPAGTLAYMAPERLKNKRATSRADVYAFGILAYHVLYGRLPCDEGTSARRDPDRLIRFHLYEAVQFPTHPSIPVFLKQMIVTCLEKDPDRRFDRGLEIAKMLHVRANLGLDLSSHGTFSGSDRRLLQKEAAVYLSDIRKSFEAMDEKTSRDVRDAELRCLSHYEALFDHDTAPEMRRLSAEARVLRGRILLEQGHYHEVLLLPPHSDAEWNTHGLACFYLGRYRDAKRMFERVVKRKGETDARGSAFNYLGMTAYHEDDPKSAERYYDQAMTCFMSTQDADGLLSLHINRGALFQSLTRYADAISAYESGLDYARRLKRRHATASLLNNLSNLYGLLGAMREAKAFLMESRSLVKATREPMLLGYNDLIAGDLAVYQEKFDAAQKLFLAAFSRFKEMGVSREMAIARTNLFDLALLRNDFKTARRYAASKSEQIQLALYLNKRPRAIDPDKDGVEESYETALAWAVFYDQRGDRLSVCEWLERACDHMTCFEKSLPIAYRKTGMRHPRFKRVLDLKARYQVEDPVKLATFKKLLEVNARMNVEHRLSHLLDFIMDAVIELSGAERGFLILSKSDARSPFKVDVARNLDRESIVKSEFKLSRTLVQKVLASGKAILSTDAAADPRLKESKSVQGLKLKSILCVPLLRRKAVLGAIYIENRFQRDVFTPDHLELLQAFSDQAAIAIENARLYEENAVQVEKIGKLNAELKTLVADQQLALKQTTRTLEKTRETFSRRHAYEAIVGESVEMEKIFHLLDRLTERDIAVLIVGESGTGKELIARALHHHGPRKDREFIAINCAAIPAQLLESELFGFVKGAFTGADRDQAGLFEVAAGGTLFLDEIGDMPRDMQAKLLRVLQEKEVRRLGSSRKIVVDVRVVSATNKDLLALAKEKKFREDLYYRLNGVTLAVPPLRERRLDIPSLVRFFLKKFSPDRERTVSPQAMTVLSRYAWPGNIRELGNEIERAVSLSDGPIDVEALSPSVRGLSSDHGRLRFGVGAAGKDSIRAGRAEYEREQIARVLTETGGNKSRAAEMLGLSRVALYQKMKRLAFV